LTAINARGAADAHKEAPPCADLGAGRRLQPIAEGVPMMIVRSYVAPSAIAGFGVFAAEAVRCGQAVWRFDPRFDSVIAKADMACAAPHVREFLERYAYELPEDPSFLVLDADNGRFLNHSSSPNVDLQDPRLGTAARDIDAGEELTWGYALLTVGEAALGAARASA
jgi:hypothetical protein